MNSSEERNSIDTADGGASPAHADPADGPRSRPAAVGTVVGLGTTGTPTGESAGTSAGRAGAADRGAGAVPAAADTEPDTEANPLRAPSDDPEPAGAGASVGDASTVRDLSGRRPAGPGDPDSADAESAGRPRGAVVRDGLGVGVAAGLSGFAFGATGAGAGLDVWQCAVLSLVAFTGASQFALAGALGAGGSPVAAVAGALFLGVRNAFYGLRLAQQLGLPAAVRPAAAHWVIDETTAVSLAQPDRRSARLGFTVTGAACFVLWNATTVAGALGADALGDPARWGLDAAGPAVFLALLRPRLSEVAAERRVALLAVVIALAATPLLPPGVPVLLTLLAVPAVLALGPAGRRREVRR